MLRAPASAPPFTDHLLEQSLQTSARIRHLAALSGLHPPLSELNVLRL